MAFCVYIDLFDEFMCVQNVLCAFSVVYARSKSFMRVQRDLRAFRTFYARSAKIHNHIMIHKSRLIR